MVQSILFFLLGFLCAAFLALMVAPAIWRRAVALTRRRIEASVPLSMNEIQADKDRMRAEFAMSTRRLEMSIQAFRDKAANQIIEIDRNRQQLKELAREKAEKSEAITGLESRGGELRAELRQREDLLQRLSERMAEAERLLEERALEIDKLGRLYDEASLTASQRQIELVARESEIERVSGDLGAMRSQNKDADRRIRELSAESRQVQEALKAEKKRAAELERKLERLVATVSDREETLDRREKEMARLREQHKVLAQSEGEISTRLVRAESDRVKLEAEIADLTLQLSSLMNGATGGMMDKAAKTLTQDRDRLEKRLAILTRENGKLKAEVEAWEQRKAREWEEQRQENAVLREQMNDLAAEVVRMTDMLEGPDSPIGAALDAQIEGALGGPGAPVSLAERVRRLKEAAGAR